MAFDTSLVAALGSLAAAAAVIVAVIFGIFQLRSERRRRRHEVTLEYARSMMDAEVVRALRRLSRLPLGVRWAAPDRRSLIS